MRAKLVNEVMGASHEFMYNKMLDVIMKHKNAENILKFVGDHAVDNSTIINALKTLPLKNRETLSDMLKL
jgi:hypothetical protein